MVIRPAYVRNTLGSGLSFCWWSRYHAVPIVGWPANDISAIGVKMSIGIIVGSSEVGGWRKTVSERLNSLAMACFRAWVKG